jgi:rubredoxin
MEVESREFQIWQCQNCHYEYEEERGDPISDIEPGTYFEDLPDDWVCPICGAAKDRFKKAVSLD